MRVGVIKEKECPHCGHKSQTYHSTTEELTKVCNVCRKEFVVERVSE